MTRMNPTKKPLLLALLMLGLAGFLMLGACQPATKKTDAPSGIRKTFKNGPATLDVTVDRAKITVADRLKLAITVSTPAGYETTLPDTLPEQNEKDKNTTFRLVEASAPSVEVGEDNRTRTRRAYVLEPFLAGTYTIPAMTVRFRKTGEAAETPDETLETAVIPITVTSLLPDKANGADIRPHDIRPPAPLPRSMNNWLLAGGSAAGILLTGIGVFLVLRKRRNVRLIAAEIVISPHEAAFTALAALMAAGYLEKGETKVFYQEISGILRRYIEARFGLRAPEQTTEEFLDGLKSGAALERRYQDLLKDFLTHCDLVKFAAFHPSGEDIRNTIDSCRTFIEETRHREGAT